jgi:DNA-binding transcriptional regulator YiaG
MTNKEFRQARINMKLSQQKFADYLGIKNSRTIRRMESGEWKVSQHIIDKLKGR